MDNLRLSVIAVLLHCNLPGAVGTKAQRILLETRRHSDCQWDGESVLNCSLTGMSTLPEDGPQTAIVADFSHNNIKTFLCADGRNEEWALKHLNLSNNLLSEISLTTCRNFPVLETLNLNGNAIHTLTLGTPAPARGSEAYGGVDRLLPALKVLSVERNNLSRVPRGLGLLPSLQTVRLSSNGIRQVDPSDFQSCSQLEDIHLQNNKITEVHSDAFGDLNKLQVVDLRQNPLATPLPQILITLNVFQLEVGLSNNAWVFNCRLHAFKHLFHLLFDSTRKKLSISYRKSASNSQKPLLYLSSPHFNCSDSVLLKRAVIPAEKTSVLKCDLGNTRGTRVPWWSPKGRISKDNGLPHMTLDELNNLVIHNAEKTDEGLYLCLQNTTKTKYLIYSTQVEERVSRVLVRKARDTKTVVRQGRTEQDLALAVCLSVLITFICAFCLGAFARPYIVSLWRLMRGNKNSRAEHAYSNRAFSDEAVSRECSAGKATHVQRHLFIRHENSSRNTCIFPTETCAFHEHVAGSNVHAPDTDENIKAYDNGPFSIRMDYKNSSEDTPRKLTSNDVSLREDSRYANNADSEESRFPPVRRRSSADSCSNHTDSSDSDLSLSATQTHPVAQDSGNGEVSNNPAPPQSGITKATAGSPERRGIVSHNEPTSTTKLTLGRQSPDGQLVLNGHTKTTSDGGDLISPSSCKKDKNTENLSVCSPLTEYNCNLKKDASADTLGDSSSDEGTPFTLSDCSSSADSDLEQPRVSDNPAVCQPSLAEAEMDSGTETFSTLPGSPHVAAELRHPGGNAEENNAYFEATSDGSDTIVPGTASPDADKRGDHVSMSDSDTVSSSSQEVCDMFDDSTNTEPENSISDSLHNRRPGLGYALLSLQHSPTYDTDTESAPEEADLQLYRFPVEPQHSLGFSPAEQESAPEGSTDEHVDRNSPAKHRGGGDAALRSTSASEDSDFTCAPTNVGLNEAVEKPSLLRSRTESPLPSPPEHRAGKHFLTEKDLLPQGEEANATEACADKAHGGFNGKNWDGYTELRDASPCSLPQETWSRNLTADWLHLPSSGKTQSVFNTEDHLPLHESDGDAYSSVPQGFLIESTRYRSCSIPQNTAISDSGKTEDGTTSAGLQNNSATAGNLQNSSENPGHKSQANSGQGQVFVKKKRAFDGFANILQSRKTDFSS